MKTTKKDFELFKSECQKWINRFELNNWTIRYSWRDLELDGLDGASNSGAWNYIAYLTLDTEIDDENIGDRDMIIEIKEAAKHEVIHLLIKRLKLKAIYRYIKDENEIVEAEEELVRKLEKIIKE